MAVGAVRLYADAGQGGRGWSLMTEKGTLFERSGARLHPASRTHWSELSMRAAIARAADESDPPKRDRYLAIARRGAVRLSRARSRYAIACGALGLGCAEAVAGKRADAVTHLEEASDGFDAVRMKLHAAAARWRLAEIVDDAHLAVAAEQVAAGEGSRNPRRLLASLAPGRFTPRQTKP
jgi:hypothetical protein